MNQGGESYIFKTEDFDGPLVLDGPNFVDAGDNPNHGIIAGNNNPVLTHYQVSQACGGECWQPYFVCLVSVLSSSTHSNWLQVPLPCWRRRCLLVRPPGCL